MTVSADEVIDDFLAHYGVKGMRWGVRKKSGKKSSEAKRFEAVDKKRKEQGLRALTNKELADFNKRAELEKKFNAFVSPQKKRKNPIKVGDEFVKSVLGAIGTGVTAYKLYNSKAVQDYIKRFRQTPVPRPLNYPMLTSGK